MIIDNTVKGMTTVNFENNKLYKFATKLLFDIVSVFVPAIAAVAIAFTFFFRTAGVDGSSMLPTLQDGNRLIITAFLAEPKYGDIVVSSQPNPLEKTLIKRVIAVGGQTVDIDFDLGMVYVDGIPLDEPYIAEPTRDREDFMGAIYVPEGYVFLMGDNRNKSTDSRSRFVGLVDEDYIMGKAVTRIFPFDSFEVN